jgi:quercetin dioxygenase-like cupin family protein
MPEGPFETRESADGLARWYFSHSDKNLTTGVLILQPKGELPKHRRPKSYESFVQVSGRSKTAIFQGVSETDIERTVVTSKGQQVRLGKGQWHTHSNPFDEVSVTFFKHVGDMTDIMEDTRRSLRPLSVEDV